MADKFYEESNGLKDDILNYVDLENLSDIKSISENKMIEIEKLSNLAKFYQTTKNMLAKEKIWDKINSNITISSETCTFNWMCVESFVGYLRLIHHLNILFLEKDFKFMGIIDFLLDN